MVLATTYLKETAAKRRVVRVYERGGRGCDSDEWLGEASLVTHLQPRAGIIDWDAVCDACQCDDDGQDEEAAQWEWWRGAR